MKTFASRGWFVTAGMLALLFIMLTLATNFPGVANSFVKIADNQIAQSLLPLRSWPALASLMQVITTLGNESFVIVLIIFVLILMMLARQKMVVFLLLLSIGASEMIALVVKTSLKRARPLENFFQIATNGYSFPSGHALIAMVFYGCIGFWLIQNSKIKWLKSILAIVTVILVFLIGFSRVFFNLHWASDVVGGWLLGATFLSLFVGFYRYRERLNS